MSTFHKLTQVLSPLLSPILTATDQLLALCHLSLHLQYHRALLLTEILQLLHVSVLTSYFKLQFTYLLLEMGLELEFLSVLGVYVLL
jgi:hypothetical protein